MLIFFRSAALLVLLAAPLPAIAAGLVVDFPGTRWGGGSSFTGKINGISTLLSSAAVDFEFGPQVSPTLAPGEFSIDLDVDVGGGLESLAIHGTYTIDAKGRPVFVVDTSDLGTDVKQFITDACKDPLCAPLGSYDIAPIDPAKVKIKVKSKLDGGVPALFVQGRVPFVLSHTGSPTRKGTIGFGSGALINP